MTCWARPLLLAVVAVLGIGQMIAACGQKGDLYLPESKPAAAPAPPAPAADSAVEPAKRQD